MHVPQLILDLAVITAVAGLVTLIFQKIRQPVVLGYIIAGLIIGPYTPPFPLITDVPNIRTLAELGVIFLMFTLGLEFSFRKLTRVGTSAAFTATFEILCMNVLGYLAGRAFGWSKMDSVFLGAMLSISSTTIIIKTLDELGLKTRRFAELIFGILVVEDLIAVLLMVGLTTLASPASNGLSPITIAVASGKLGIVVGSWLVAGFFIVPRFIGLVGRYRSDEMLIVVATGLCLGLVGLAAHFGYSAALGAFIMGSILSETTESRRIEDLMRPLRDLFVAIFFVSIGMLINPSDLVRHGPEIAMLTLLVIAGKVAGNFLGTLITGQKLQTAILVSFGLAQIGEFSFIIAGLGLSLGVLSEHLYPVVVAVSVTTAFCAPYLLRWSYPLSRWIEAKLPTPTLRALDRYRAWRERQIASKGPAPDFNRRAGRWALNGFVVAAIQVGIASYALPIFQRTIANPSLALAAAWALAALLSAPFIWAMLFSFEGYRRTDGAEPPDSPAPIVAQILSVLWLSLLSLAFFPARYVGIATIAVGSVLATRLFRRMEHSYRWFEQGFLATFREHQKTRPPVDVFRQLAPWDGHLVRIKVHPDSEISGKKLLEVALRKKHGLNVVAIQRGSRTLVAPRPDQQIFPKDELLVLGTDEDIDRVRSWIENPAAGYTSDRIPPIEGYELRSLFIDESSQLRGRTVRDSKLRENFGAMVVGIERDGRRLMNPDTDMDIQPGDILWLVGESTRLDEILLSKDSAQ